MPFWMAARAWWEFTAKPWFSKYWMWVVFPVGILLLLLGWSRKPKELVVVDTQLHKADAVKDKVSTELEAKKEELREQRDEKISDALEEHDEAVKEVLDKQEKAAPALVDDPEKLNDYLLKVGKNARRG